MGGRAGTVRLHLSYAMGPIGVSLRILPFALINKDVGIMLKDSLNGL